MNLREFLAVLASLLFVASATARARCEERKQTTASERTVRVALVQFDAVPEQVEQNREQMVQLAKQAAAKGARWVLFHEGAVCDYTPRLDELAEPVPDGPTTRRMTALAKELNVFLSFGLSERDGERFYITQVFVGPAGFVTRYRKTSLWHSPEDQGYRNEWSRYDPGSGPELFEIDGVKATCFICADGNSDRCLERMHLLRPQVAFHPNNRKSLTDDAEYTRRAKSIGAPLLVPNRVGNSWMHACDGGSSILDADGTLLARANRDGREEILIYDLPIPAGR